MTWPRSNLEMMQETVPKYIDNEPFHVVMFRNKSFITDRGKYNSATKEFIPTEEDNNDDFYDYIDAISLIQRSLTGPHKDHCDLIKNQHGIHFPCWFFCLSN